MAKNQSSQNHRLQSVLIIAGVVILLAAVALFKKNASTPAAFSNDGSPQQQLGAALKTGRPALAFYHSNNCQSCLDMIAIVAQVYPQFQSSVALIDVDVYDERNRSLLAQAGVQAIPTMFFYDGQGRHQRVVGVMKPEDLRQKLSSISAQK